MTNLNVPYFPTYTEINFQTVGIAGGAAGYVDTDLSAYIPTTARAVVFSVSSVNAQDSGVRKKRSTADPRVGLQASSPMLEICGVDTTCMVQIYRNTIAVTYVLIGYIS